MVAVTSWLGSEVVTVSFVVKLFVRVTAALVMASVKVSFRGCFVLVQNAGTSGGYLCHRASLKLSF